MALKNLPPRCCSTLCARVGDAFHDPVPGIIKQCYNCGHDIHLALSTIDALIQHPQIPVYICMECAVLYAEQIGKFTPVPMTPKQRRDIFLHGGRNN